MTFPNNNPTGINQYTRHSAGALRTKSGKFYHGTRGAFPGLVKAPYAPDGVFATTSLKTARHYAGMSSSISYGNKTGRVLQVSPGKGASMFDPQKYSGRSLKREVVARSGRPMGVVRTLPTLHKPSRRK